MIREVLESYTRDLSTNVWQRQEYKGIAYSDGDEVERRLKKIIQSAADVSVMSVELARQCTDWPSRYHLSNQRANLLRPFEDQLRGGRVLEIGAGCGAITRYFGEVGAEVLALEGSLRRASIAALRCRDLENVTVVAEAVHAFPLAPQFDVVTLIGVLEYARKFFPGEGEDPVDAMLKYVTGFLKPGGRLFLAIENQLGLKYFAGFPEDHMGQSMFGIEEHYGCSNVVTFGRKDLGDRVSKAGLTSNQWWYPFPDYKLPSLMISDQGALPMDDMDLFPLVRHACSQDLQDPLSVSFNQERAWRPIMRNGLLKEMANSFLLVASDTEISETPGKPVALHYATNRRSEFAKQVLFTRTKAGLPMTHQIALYPQAIPDNNSMVKLRLEHQAFVQGQLWQDRLVDIMTSPDWSFEQVQQWFQVWLEAFYCAAGIVRTANLMCEKISGTYIDMTPRNLIVAQNGEFKFFDQEWEYVEAIQVGYIVYRALITSIGEMRKISKPLEETNSQTLPLMIKIAESVGFSFSTQHIKEYMALELNFQNCVVGVDTLSTKALYSEEKGVAGIALPKPSLPKKNSNTSVFECSIIIPVFNKVELTQQCLMHLAKVTTGISYEVVIVDNHSTDGTREFLGLLDGDIQIIQNSTNLGFAKGCNQGARAAKGKHLVFLNNDTIPKPGWLDPLIKEVVAHEDVAVVGSKLLYPDNTIQHAGVVFSRLFQTPYHIYCGAHESFPAVNIRKEFQVVTAACMLVRKEAFEKVGGFDEGFVNGFEDVDFCLKIRQTGKKVVYQPKSCLYHLESQSPGRKKNDLGNMMRLIKRWEHQWLADEDIYVHQDGCVIQQSVSEEKLKSRITPINNVPHSAAWQRVVDLQEILLGRKCQSLTEMTDNQKIRELLVDVDAWPMDIGILEWVGRICETLQCAQQAVQIWEKLLIIGDHPNARLGLARAMLKNGNLDEAQRHLDELKRVFTPRDEGWTLQGILSMQRQEFSEAKLAFRQALAMAGESQKAQMGLGMAYLGLEQPAEAWNIFEEVLSGDPDNIEAIHCLVQAGTVLQRWESLSGCLARFVERNPAVCDMRFALAGVQFRAGQSDQAKEHVTWLRLIKPDYEGLEDLEKLLGTSQSSNNLVSTR